jgi:hypothetical protein
MNMDEGTTVAPRRRVPVAALAIGAGALVVIAALLAAVLAPGDAPVESAPGSVATVTPAPTPVTEEDPGPPSDAWIVAFRFMDGIRNPDPTERNRIVRATAIERYADEVKTVAEWKLPRGTIEKIELPNPGSIRFILRAEELHTGKVRDQAWTVGMIEDPLALDGWRVGRFLRDDTWNVQNYDQEATPR